MRCAISLLFGPQRVDSGFQYKAFRKRGVRPRHLAQHDDLLGGRLAPVSILRADPQTWCFESGGSNEPRTEIPAVAGAIPQRYCRIRHSTTGRKIAES